MDEQVIGDAARRIGTVAIALHNRGRDNDRDMARAIGAELKRIQMQLRPAKPGAVCKTFECGNPVPAVKFGRPREYCESCHPPRYKVANKVTPAESIST